MVLRINIDKLWARLALAFVAAACAALLVYEAGSDFLLGALTDTRVRIGRDTLAFWAASFPNSAALNARLARAEMRESNRDLGRAEAFAARAIELSPYDFNNRVILASIKEAQGDRQAAEAELRAASELAPGNTDVRWRLANVLIRGGKPAESLAEFRLAAAANLSLLPATFDLVWRVSGGNLSAMEAVTTDDPKARLALAGFLLKETRAAEAVEVFGKLDRQSRQSAEGAHFLNALITAKQYETARALWMTIASDSAADSGAVSNGGFESAILKDFAQFDWAISRSEYARISIDTATAHGGAKSLRVDFIGRDTTRLDGEIKQLVLLRPGARYQLECFVKTQDLTTPEGPRIVMTGVSSNWEAASDAIAAASDWQRVAINFETPKTSEAVTPAYIAVRRKPRFSYDDPTRGSVWFDDFTLRQQ
jgi:tetratricopeptide (TPR) repeat protein